MSTKIQRLRDWANPVGSRKVLRSLEIEARDGAVAGLTLYSVAAFQSDGGVRIAATCESHPNLEIACGIVIDRLTDADLFVP